MLETVSIRTPKRNDMIDVTAQVADIVTKSGVNDGLAVVYVPHTTAGVTINENADPDVVHDMLLTLEELVPHRRRGYRHGEGNSDAHVKSTLVGPSLTIIIESGRLLLGTWQGIYFCEFDGPRTRRFSVKIIKNPT